MPAWDNPDARTEQQAWVRAGSRLGSLLAAGSLSAETFYEQDGIILEGSVRLVHRDAATCQVLAESESPETYEATKANHGRPLHVWRLDYGAFNGSGESLGQLTAHFRIESEWPPCTNWTGLGQYPGPVQWAGTFETLPRTGGLEAGGEARETLYVLAIDGEQPRFRNWQLDFRLGEAAAPPQVEAAAPPAPKPPLPEPRCHGMVEDAACWKELASDPACFVWDWHYYPNQTVTWTGTCSDGLASGDGTLTWVREGEHVSETVTVRRGRYNGRYISLRNDGFSAQGTHVDGQRQGRWSLRFPSGQIEEGAYVDDKRHGTWVIRPRDQPVWGAEYVHGEKVD